MNNARNDGKSLWAEAAIACHAHSDAKIALYLNRTSQQIGKFRRENKTPTDKFVSECRKALCLTALPSGLYGGWVYAAIRNYVVDHIFGSTCPDDIQKMLNRLDQLKANMDGMADYLEHLKATVWIIAKHPTGPFRSMKNAQHIHEQLQQKTQDPYLKAVSLSQLTNIRYMLHKYFDGDKEQLSKAQAQALLRDSYEVTLILNNLPAAINLAEIASVAEDTEKLAFAYEKINASVSSKYLADAIAHHLATRDGAAFRINNNH